MSVMDAEPLPTSPQPPKQARNGKVRKLAVQIRETKQLRLAVELVPLAQGQEIPASMPSIKPLADW